MPTYVYKFIETGETIEVQQAFTDPTLTRVRYPGDGKLKKVKKVFQPVGVTFRGSGFYKTDSRGGSSKASPVATGESSGSSSESSTPASSATESTKSAESSKPSSGEGPAKKHDSKRDKKAAASAAG